MSDFDDEEYESFELDGAGKPRDSGAAPAEADDDLDDDDDLEDAAEDEIDFVLAAYREDGQPYVQALAKDLANDFDELIIQLRRLPGDAGALGFVSLVEEVFVLVRVRGPACPGAAVRRRRRRRLADRPRCRGLSRVRRFPTRTRTMTASRWATWGCWLISD